jgi:branched-subunit amino acid transport protein
MSTIAVLVTSLLAWLQKYVGHLVPRRWVEGERVSRAAALLPVALLAGLIAVSTLSTSDGISVDARVAGLAAAFVALVLRAPFLLVLVVAAATAALLRVAGLAA